MAYYVDAGGPVFEVFDTAAEARAYAETQLDAARNFACKMGFMPYWGRVLEIRKGPGADKIAAGMRANTTAYNAAIMAKTKTHTLLRA